MISAQFTLDNLNCVSQAEITKKNSLKTPILGVQDCSRSSILVPLESSSAVLMCDKQQVCLSVTVLTLDEVTW